jgi:DNA-binding HxlR family transcriptional regulator
MEMFAEDLTIPVVLRLLGSGAAGAILMALSGGPLRTKTLTERVYGFTPRTIYRYTGKLTQLGVLEREEEPGVPSKVVHSLSDPSGQELRDLLVAYGDFALAKLPNGEIDAQAWSSLGLLADLWESGMIEALNSKPRSPTELARGEHELSYHQVHRRAGLFAASGFLEESLAAGGKRQGYALTDKARRGIALIAGIGHWRRWNLQGRETAGATPFEVAVMLRTALPLVNLPEHADKSFKLSVTASSERNGSEGEIVWGRIAGDGALSFGAGPVAHFDGWGRGEAGAWMATLCEGSHQGIRFGGDSPLVAALLTQLHRELWPRKPLGSPASTEAVTAGNDSPELSYS